MRPFERILTEHGPVVMRVCRALLGPADAEDAWSETFISALQAYPSLRPDSNLRGWLVTIAHRKSIDQIRSRARAPQPTAHIADLADRADFANNNTAGRRAESDPALWDALESLPPKQRAAVVYHHLGGLPFSEVGELLGTSAAAARRSGSDGIANLRNRYSPDRPIAPAPHHTKGTRS